jgi:hypothetical protein
LGPVNAGEEPGVRIQEIMKPILCLAVLSVSLAAVRAHDVYIAPDYASGVSYSSPVVYQAPAIYQAPVTYYAPVYYVASAAAAAVQISSDRYCPSPRSRSTVIHITDGRGTYSTSQCDYSDSTVVVIGSSYARRSGGIAPIRRSWFGHRSSFLSSRANCW